MPGVSASGAAWRGAWTAFRTRPEPLLLPVLAAGVAWITVQVLVQITIGATVTRGRPCVRRLGALLDPTTCDRHGVVASNALVLSVLGLLVLGQLFWAVALRGAAGLDDPAAPLPPLARTLPRAAGLALLLGVVITLGVGIGVIPGLVVALVTQFAMLGVVVEGRGPLAAIGASARRLVGEPVVSCTFAVLLLSALAAGALLGLVGLWPATCVAALAQVRLWRRPSTAPAT